MNDLAEAQPERAAELAAKWQAYAERANVLPLNPSARKKGSFSKKKRFKLTKGADLSRERAPFVEGRGFQVTARFVANGKDGVIVAQGGSSHGYALYVKDDRVNFATRHQGTLTVVALAKPLDAGKVVVEVTLAKDGAITLSALSPSGTEEISGKIELGPLKTMPLDGLQVGQDVNGAVGPYEAPFAFEGEIDKVQIRLDKSKG